MIKMEINIKKRFCRLREGADMK